MHWVFSKREDAMLTREDNELLTRTGPGTPMGELFRRFWMPALLAEELSEPDCPPVRIKIMGEQLVAFRDTDGKVGVLDNYCSHRRASLFFGRNEECGLRCVYHGWKFDVNGDCVDMPSEPAESNFKEKVKIKAYPAREYGSCVWIYMGPPGAPTGASRLRVGPRPGRPSHGDAVHSALQLHAVHGGRDRLQPRLLPAQRL